MPITIGGPSLKQVRDFQTKHDEHFHSRERWQGKSGNQSGDDWATEAGLTVFRVISGDGDFGSDANDEAKVLGIDDTPTISGNTEYDIRRVMISASSNATDWILRFIYGTAVMNQNETDGQYTDIMLTSAKKGIPGDDVRLPRLVCGVDKIWAKGKNASNNATLDFFIGLHEYLG
ncbi:hypothetical protein LCGC14_2197810 [marine sediment metagenome]|uniref:Uncharacterized protein n=1 Tax=marine sediment metagenome TaxID=412755 RepID=A0A0F9DHK5_9ZZZZ